MPLLFLVLSVAVTAALTVYLAAQLLANPRPRELGRRLAEIEAEGPWSAPARARRAVLTERITALLDALGQKLQVRYEAKGGKMADMLMHAGDRRPNALGRFWATRYALTAVLFAFGMLALPLLRLRPAGVLGGSMYMAVTGWMLPLMSVRSRRRARQKELQLALADALDLMVVCVEAGLGLNQALVRVSKEIRYVSPLMSDELDLVNLEMRAGTPRDTALNNLGHRTGLDDIRALTTMLIQTDRFGTSIAQSLRVHSDTLRTKRRQRAEEAAAKTTIKMVFPLVFCIFPAMFVVLIGPGLIQIGKALMGLK